MGKTFEKQTKEEVKAMKYLNISDKANGFRQNEKIFSKDLINDLIITKLKKTIVLENNIELDRLNYKNYNFNKISFPTISLRDIHTKDLSMKNGDIEQSDLFRALKNLKKAENHQKKSFF